MKIGDLVMASEDNLFGFGFDDSLIGIVVDTDINMWGEEVVPSGISVLWSTGDVDTLYEDEIDMLNEA